MSKQFSIDELIDNLINHKNSKIPKIQFLTIDYHDMNNIKIRWDKEEWQTITLNELENKWNDYDYGLLFWTWVNNYRHVTYENKKELYYREIWNE